MNVPHESMLNPNENESFFIFVCLLGALIIKMIISLFFRLTRKITKFIDLHFHLDGSITVEIAKELAKLQNIKLEAKNDLELEAKLQVQENCESLNDFLSCFPLPLSLLQKKEGLRESIRLIAENISSQGVIYAEIRFAPQLHQDKGMSQEDAVKAALSGLQRIKDCKIPIKVNLILCLMRGDKNQKENEETLRLAKKYLVEDGGVVAIDLAGAEALFPTSNYKEIFEKAKKLGIPFTIHAGEADGPESVRTAIEFGAKRIGHGTRAYEDKSVVELIKEKGVFLEMCPTSNKQTHAIKDMKDFPFMDYLKQGINVTLNTDDMGIEGTTLKREFEYMEREFKLNYKQEKSIILNSVNAAFTSDEVKDELKRQLGL